MNQTLLCTQSLFFGENALERALDSICALGSKALIVTGSSMLHQGYVNDLQRLLQQNNIKSAVFSGVTGEPTDVMIEAGLAEYRQERCNFIIGFGGGSQIDAAKAIGAMAENPGCISDYMGKEIPNSMPPLVAIPSTAGTGSETTQFTIISDTYTQIKMLLKGAALMPNIAVVDPLYSMNLPPQMTAASGLDALTHAVEAYTSKKAFEETDAYALSAIKRIFSALPTAYENGKDKAARETMALAAYEAGVCINNSSVTIVHGMSRPIGALFHVSHGLSNAMLLRECLTFALPGALERFAQLGRAIGAAPEQMCDADAAQAFLTAVGALCRSCHIPTLEEYGIDRATFFTSIDKMAQDAFDSGSPSNTRRVPTVADMKEIYAKL